MLSEFDHYMASCSVAPLPLSASHTTTVRLLPWHCSFDVRHRRATIYICLMSSILNIVTGEAAPKYGVYGFGGLEWWNGMVEWNGLEWNGMEWPE